MEKTRLTQDQEQILLQLAADAKSKEKITISEYKHGIWWESDAADYQMTLRSYA